MFSLSLRPRRRFNWNARAEKRRRARAIWRRALRNLGDDFIRMLVKDWLSGRKANDTGLNRITGHAARGWQRVVVNNGDTVVLVVFTNVEYMVLHTDEPDAEEVGGRRFKMRVPSRALWNDFAQHEDVGELLDRAFRL